MPSAEQTEPLQAVNGAARAEQPGPGMHDETTVRQRFIEAARRAELVTLINAADTEPELGRTFAAELCAALDAEIAFVAEQPRGPESPAVIGSIGCDPVCVATLVAALGSGSKSTVRAITVGPQGLTSHDAQALLVVPFQLDGDRRLIVGVARLYDEPFNGADRALLESVTTSVGQAFERLRALEDRNRTALQQSALLRAAKAMALPRAVPEMLRIVCAEIDLALPGALVSGSIGDEVNGYEVRAANEPGESLVGFSEAAGMGLGGQAIRASRPMLTNAFHDEGYAPAESELLGSVRAALAVPLRWDGRVRGFITVGFTSPDRRVTGSDLALIEGFAEIAGLACSNSERHAALQDAASVDGMTGAINRVEFNRRLARMCDACEMAGEGLALVMLDLDGFKSINEDFGHQAGDAVLQTVGRALISAVRGDDLVARYGGDEFALILPGTTERGAIPVLDRVTTAIQALETPGGRLTACMGVAEREPGTRPNRLIRAADEALRAAKNGSGVGSMRRAGANREIWPGGRREGDTQPGRLDRSRALAGDLGLRIARQHDALGAAEVAVSEIGQALSLASCAVIRVHRSTQLEVAADYHGDQARPGWIDRQDPSIVRVLHEKVAVIVDRGGAEVVEGKGGDPERRNGIELLVPVRLDGRIWGLIACRALGEGRRLDSVDGGFVSAVAEHLSAAIRAAGLYEQLAESMVGTAEALAAALEAKDSYTADHARSIAEIAVEVGRQMGLSESALEDLRYGGIFHDVGKIAVPDSLINKPGPLTEAEFEVVKCHPEAGAEILAPVPYLSGVRSIVRHAHEHWDGGGYPNGLAGEEIPLGARIVLAVDAWHAMTSDRPYRDAMSEADALTELRDNSGTQFDPEVVDALLTVLERSEAVAGA